MWQKIYIDAVSLAVSAHAGQTRKFSAEPYIMHPLRVSKTIYILTGDLKLSAAGVCHDVLEDTVVSYSTLAEATHEDIARLVRTVTKDTSLSKADKEKEFLGRFKDAQLDTVILKLADRVDNLKDIESQPIHFRERYIKNTEELLGAMPRINHKTVNTLIDLIMAKI